MSNNNTPATQESAPVDENQLIAERREKLKVMRERQAQGLGVAFPNDFKPAHHAINLHALHGEKSPEALVAEGQFAKVAGRMMLKRVMGKASFATLQDSTGRIQIYITRDDVNEELYADFKHWDLGDIIACEGKLFKTRMGELSIHASSIRMLTKSLRPMPDKFHGVNDQEIKYRQRYVDLMMDETARTRFVARSKAVSGIRDFMVQHNFLEVETPMLHPIPGGANAKPFVTHHNALDQEMFLRIAPELYLKRLIVGGFERVFEINRNFRNEGADSSHSPEFAMIESYQAYGDWRSIADLTRSLVQNAAMAVAGSHTVTHHDGRQADLGGKWKEISLYDAISQGVGETVTALTPIDDLKKIATKLGMKIDPKWITGKLAEEIFEHVAKDQLIEPTFVMGFPVDTSPLVRAHREIPGVAEKWDLYVDGFELATGYSELIDPVIQRERLVEQATLGAKGDLEAMQVDEDFLRAMEFAMPPMGGMGMGVDRLLMALTGLGIRETILFPLVKPEIE